MVLRLVAAHAVAAALRGLRGLGALPYPGARTYAHSRADAVAYADTRADAGAYADTRAYAITDAHAMADAAVVIML